MDKTRETRSVEAVWEWTRPLRVISERLKRLKAWVEAFAEKPYALTALFVLAFVEASFFPVPPDVLLIALAVSQPKRSFRYATICTIGSVMGAFLGYYIGYAFFETMAKPILNFYHAMGSFQVVLDKYRENAFTAIVIAGFTPIPYKVFTIAAGFDRTVSLATLALASLVGRSGRFFLVAWLISMFGPTVKTYIDRYFDLLSLVLILLLILGFVAIRWVF